MVAAVDALSPTTVGVRLIKVEPRPDVSAERATLVVPLSTILSGVLFWRTRRFAALLWLEGVVRVSQNSLQGYPKSVNVPMMIIHHHGVSLTCFPNSLSTQESRIGTAHYTFRCNEL